MSHNLRFDRSKVTGGALVPDELVTAVAATVATKGAEALVAGGRSALAAMVRLIRDHFGRGTPEAATLQAAMEHPDERERRAALAEALAQAFSTDSTFVQQVLAHWEKASTDLAADHGAVVNNFSGSAERVVQARDIIGDISF
jgi:hypothetical protein